MAAVTDEDQKKEYQATVDEFKSDLKDFQDDAKQYLKQMTDLEAAFVTEVENNKKEVYI